MASPGAACAADSSLTFFSGNYCGIKAHACVTPGSRILSPVPGRASRARQVDPLEDGLGKRENTTVIESGAWR